MSALAGRSSGLLARHFSTTRSKSWGSMPATEFETGSLTLAVVDWTAFGLENHPNPNAIVMHVELGA